MGYSNNGNTFEPDDDENTIYLKNSNWITLADIIYIVQSKWPELLDLDLLESININAENIHTDCLGYDLHNYTNFIVITKDA